MFIKFPAQHSFHLQSKAESNYIYNVYVRKYAQVFKMLANLISKRVIHRKLNLVFNPIHPILANRYANVKKCIFFNKIYTDSGESNF